MSKKKVVIVGGGTFSSAVCEGFKHTYDCSVVYTVADDGGSAGRIRLDHEGVLPSSDAAQALLAAMPRGELDAEVYETVRALLTARFSSGRVYGMKLSGYMILALEHLYGPDEAIGRLAQLFGCIADVIPVATSPLTLIAKYVGIKSEVIGESNIDAPTSHTQKRAKIARLYFENRAHINPRAKRAIENSDYIVLAGDIATSIVPNLLVDGFWEALLSTGSPIVYMCNLMTKPGQSWGFSIWDHVSFLNQYLPPTRQIQFVLAQDGFGGVDENVLEIYRREGSVPVIVQAGDKVPSGVRLFFGNLIDVNLHTQDPHDLVRRSILRHNPDAILVLFNKVVSGEY